MPPTLLDDLLWSLDDDARRRVSALRIWRDVTDADRGWVVTLSYAGMSPVHRERDDDGVTRTDYARDPSTTHPLPALAGADPHAEVQQAVVALERSGLVGHVTAARYESETLDAVTRAPFPAWLVTTHAGSDAERVAWLQSLRAPHD